MTALTVCQPYAELIVSGAKPIENRVWPTSYRGPLVIHAGKSLDWLDDGDDPRRYVFGAVVGVVDLYDCVRLDQLPALLADHEHANGPWCWLLRDPRRVGPFPCRGAQGLWRVSDEVRTLMVSMVAGPRG